MVELKPCPFCGSEAIYQETAFNWANITCTKCFAKSPQVKISGKYSAYDKAAEQWNKRTEEKKTLFGYDLGRLIIFAECCREVGITETDLANVEDCCKLAIEATEKAMEESFRKSFERIKEYGRTD